MAADNPRAALSWLDVAVIALAGWPVLGTAPVGVDMPFGVSLRLGRSDVLLGVPVLRLVLEGPLVGAPPAVEPRPGLRLLLGRGVIGGEPPFTHTYD